MTATTQGTGAKFRPDIEGLRALAVSLVVLFHVGVPGFAGGYVGVDVFFVLSGFLITGLLVSEFERSNTIRLREFYARRIRRLLPASLLVVAATIGTAAVRYSPLRMVEFRGEAVSTVAYVANFHFSRTRTDYFADQGASPLQHYWSLAVEEQFYVIWPVLILGACWVARRRPGGDRYIWGLVALILTASLAASMMITPVDRASAFFLPHTRAWEFAVGALLALIVRRYGPAEGRPARLALLVGLAAIGVATAGFDGATLFPGLWALLPVLGTAGVIYGGVVDQPVQRVMSSTVSTWLGRRSYSVYLWHWPLLVLFGEDQGTLERVLLAGVSVVAAGVTYRWLEYPVRHQASLSVRASRSLAFGAALSLVGALLAIWSTSPRLLNTGVIAEPVSSDTVAAQLADVVDVIPDNLRPSLLEVRRSLPSVYRDGCHRGFPNVDVEGCVYGAADGPVTVVLWGDSHAAQWFPAFEQMADAHGWRLVSMTKSSCAAVDAPSYLAQLEEPYVACLEWRENVHRRIEAEVPELVVIANHSHGHRDRNSLERWTEGLEATLTRVAVTAPVLLVGDNPLLDVDPPVCLSAALHDAGRCASATEQVVDDAVQAAEARAAGRAGGTFLSTVELVCDDGVCPVIVGDVLMYRDRHHLTPEFVHLLVPSVEMVVLQIIGEI